MKSDNKNLIEWLYEHNQATEDALNYFQVETLEEIPHDNLVDWVACHSTLWEDCKAARLGDIDYNAIDYELSMGEPDICD